MLIIRFLLQIFYTGLIVAAIASIAQGEWLAVIAITMVASFLREVSNSMKVGRSRVTGE